MLQNGVKTRLPDHLRTQTRDAGPGPVATFLGLFSLGLGLAELLAPKRMGELTGVHNESLLQAYGAREVITGIGILTSDSPGGWLWARVAGDALDIATLAVVCRHGTPDDARKAAEAIAAVAGVMALDVASAQSHS